MSWQHQSTCPLAAVDQRLDDLHRLWHQAEKAYFDPDEFRVAIQAAIQTSRTVTFVLQNHKSVIPDFERLHKEWISDLGSDPLMVWMRDARNNIEKRGDLDASSFIRAEIIASYLDNGPRIDVPADLWDAPLQLVKHIPANLVGEHVRKEGILRIQRRWIEKSLPKYELLDAVAIAYGRLSLLVEKMHRELGLMPAQDTASADADASTADPAAGRLPCMIGHEEPRTENVWLATGVPVEVVAQEQPPVDLSHASHFEARYGTKIHDVYGESSDPLERLRSIFSTARTLFEKDGYHRTIAFLLQAGGPVGLNQLSPGEHGHLYLLMRHLAQEVTRTGADSVVIIGESWRAPFDPSAPFRGAAESPAKREFLTGSVATKSGPTLLLSAEIHREGSTPTLGPTAELSGGVNFSYAPIYEAWGRPLPKEGELGGTRDFGWSG